LPVSAISFEAFSIFRASFILLCSGVKRDFGHSLNLVARRLEVHMTKCLLAFALSIPLCGQCQTYADSPFYRTTTAVPTTAHVEGWEHGSIKANGVVIDLSESVPWSSPDFDEIRGWSVRSWVDKNKPAHTFHYVLHYDQLNVAFGYDLLVEPVKGTDEIRCTFSALTDPDELPEMAWPRIKDIAVVALPADLTPVVIKSGDAISITTLPLGLGKIAPVHYLRLTRIDLAPAPTQ
jgi:hypothetical protein